MKNIGKCYRYIYETTLPDGRVYVGKHTPKHKGEAFDWYLGSGIILTRYINKHGREGITKRILVEGEFTLDEINELEKKYVAEYKLKENCINLARGGDGGQVFWGTKRCTKEDLRKQGERSKQQFKKYPESYKRGYIKASETYKKKYQQGLIKSQKGENNGMFGKHHTDEAKQKMSENRKGESNGSFGKHWWTNGTETIKCEACPEGFWAGRNGSNNLKDIKKHKEKIEKRKEERQKHLKKYKCIETNEIGDIHFWKDKINTKNLSRVSNTNWTINGLHFVSIDMMDP